MFGRDVDATSHTYASLAALAIAVTGTIAHVAFRLTGWSSPRIVAATFMWPAYTIAAGCSGIVDAAGWFVPIFSEASRTALLGIAAFAYYLILTSPLWLMKSRWPRRVAVKVFCAACALHVAATIPLAWLMNAILDIGHGLAGLD